MCLNFLCGDMLHKEINFAFIFVELKRGSSAEPARRRLEENRCLKMHAKLNSGINRTRVLRLDMVPSDTEG